MALMEPDVLALLVEHRVAHLSHLLVAARHRRRGAGRALLAAAVGYADEHGYDQIVVGVSPHSRDANRFFARLGFVPMVTHRLASVAMLRRSLGLPEPVAEVRMRPAAGRRLRLARPPQRALARIKARRNPV
jgi:GNAT superfamily N-acetyltransferase